MEWANESREGKLNDDLRIASCCSVLAKDASDAEDPSEIVVDSPSSSSATCSSGISALGAVDTWTEGDAEGFCAGGVAAEASISRGTCSTRDADAACSEAGDVEEIDLASNSDSTSDSEALEYCGAKLIPKKVLKRLSKLSSSLTLCGQW